jgi:hypothetical protein
VPFSGNAVDQVQDPVDFGAAEIDREEHHLQTLRVRVGGGLDRKLDGFLELPLVGVLNDVSARWHLHHDAGDAAIDSALHVIYHATGERENLGTELALDDLLDGRGVARLDHRHPGFDTVHAGFSQPFGDADFIVLGEDDASLLLAIAQCDVVKFDLLREMKLRADGFREIPRTNKPFIGFPRFL